MTADPGLCASCRYSKKVESARGSTFYRCTVPELPKYPRLPVRECKAYEETPEREEK